MPPRAAPQMPAAASLAPLASLRRLKELDLSDNAFVTTEELMAHVARLPSLLRLAIRNVHPDMLGTSGWLMCTLDALGTAVEV